MADVPDIRVGTEEREQALTRLSEHFSAGRLSVAEFDERSGQIAAATTRRQIDAVFTDLPDAIPDSETPEKKQPKWDWFGAVIAATPIIAVVLFFVLGSWLWFLLIPVVPAVLEGGRRAIKS
ncbi:DUF1707 domain-containing protein [Antrihabitans sp. YC2-6]|uniref:DUF1707 SHOCT-like domain-containing protein n=1 Tax=Antrihabitans sp. YC2-6 TaxID=2799498 RepID=UPI0018F67B1A|nr:DUF1707 domain-containing protein [Antrihabitans sp. YC2-6]MBJ8347343.1 DUF1707 domain-containing protein [Antrihabitans sp. YC2-6]